MTNTPALSVIKYDPASSWSAACSEDINEGDLIYLDTSGEWAQAINAVSTLATHVALKDGWYEPDGTENQTTDKLTGFTRGQVRLSTVSSYYGGAMYTGVTPGQYSDIHDNGATEQMVGTLLGTTGNAVNINIVPINNNVLG